MQMWVKDAASNKFLKVVDRWGGGACPSSRFLTFLTSTQTVPFPTSLLWVHRPRGGGYEARMRLGAKSTAPMHSPPPTPGRRRRRSDWKVWAQETVEFTHSRESCGGESALPFK